MLEHIELLIAVLSLLGGMFAVVAVGGVHVGRITAEIRNLATALKDGFRKNHDDHAELFTKTDDLAERVTRVETKVDNRNGRSQHRSPDRVVNP